MKKKGFTLMEFIIVLAIIGILAAILVPSWISWIKTSRLKAVNNEARVIFNASQTIVQEYNFRERNITDEDKKNIGSGEFVFYWDRTHGHKLDPADLSGASTLTPATATFNEDFSRKINKMFTDSDLMQYKIKVNNYMVKAVVAGKKNNDLYLGSYPVKQTDYNHSQTIRNFKMAPVEIPAAAPAPPAGT